MAVVEVLRPPSFLATTLIDALVMITLAFPVLYALSFRPLVRLSESRLHVQKELEAANAELEAANLSEREARATAEAIRSAAIALTQSLDLETVLAALLQLLGRLVPFDRARVMLLENESLLSRARRALESARGGVPAIGSRHVRCGLGNPVIRELLAGARGIRIADMRAHPEFGPRMRPEFERSWMGIPLVAGGKPIGLYSLCRAEVGLLSRGTPAARGGAVGAGVRRHSECVAVRGAARQPRAPEDTFPQAGRSAGERKALVARELHDEAGQALTSLKIGLRLLERMSQDLRVSAKAAQLQRTADGIQEGLHRLAANLRPVSLDHFGLVTALGQLVENLSGSGDANVELETIGLTDDRFPPDVETQLYRIAQEAVTNAVRHARAKEIGVMLQHRDGRLRLIVEDDGCGFDPAGAERSGCLGLVGIRERAETLGGTLSVESSAGAGTTVVLDAPDGG